MDYVFGFLLTVVSSGAVSGFILMVGQTLIGERIKLAIRHEYEEKISALKESLRAENETNLAIFRSELQLQQDTQIGQLQSNLEQQRALGQKRFDLFVGSYQKVWNELLELQKFLQNEMTKRIEHDGVFDPSSWNIVYDAHFTFHKMMLFLPESITADTTSLLERLVTNVNSLRVLLSDFLEEKESGVYKHSEKEWLTILNNQITKTNNEYSRSLKGLKKRFQKEGNKIIFGNEKWK